MELKIFQKGFNYSQDGQGNRLVYHLQGCNMDCAWCANPEGINLEGVMMVDKEWLATALCPKGAVSQGELDRDFCRECGERMCLMPKYRSKGLRCSCETVSIGTVFGEIKRSCPMFYDGGGVTFTGGEATLQFEPLKELLKRLQHAGIHTALETNGTHQRLPELFPYIDQLMIDCKHWEEKAHKRYTGASLTCVLENLQKAAAQHPQLDVRTPVIGQVNDGDEDMRQFVNLYNKLSGPNVTFEILRYHEFGRSKWEACGFAYAMTKEAYVSAERWKIFRQMVIDHGLAYKST